jgi:hypothetical protein
MQYKVIIVHQKATLCSTTPITGEIERAANAMSAEGYELVTAYQQENKRCLNQKDMGAVLVFAKRAAR